VSQLSTIQASPRLSLLLAGSDVRRRNSLTTRLLVVFVAMEIVLRIGVYAALDRNPYFLFFGFQSMVSQVDVSPWSVYDGEYYKYPPDYELRGAAGQADETARTNALGFRGADFEPEKDPETFRVVCLGGSSTFGFHNADEETYPHALQELLRADEATRHVEVINAGFPYYNTATILGLFESEVLAYDPDVVTVYTGYNDSSWPLSVSPVTKGFFWLQERSIVYWLLKRTALTDRNVYELKKRIMGPIRGRETHTAPPEEVEAVAARFRENLRALTALAEEHGVEVVLIAQPITVRHANDWKRSLTYEGEYQKVLEEMHISEFDRRLVRHHRLVEEVRELAAEGGHTVVDNIAIVDRDRDLLTSHVHLTAEGNRLLAQALRDAIAPLASGPRAD
jgi:lysophospholipase L1-like esterase